MLPFSLSYRKIRRLYQTVQASRLDYHTYGPEWNPGRQKLPHGWQEDLNTGSPGIKTATSAIMPKVRADNKPLVKNQSARSCG